MKPIPVIVAAADSASWPASLSVPGSAALVLKRVADLIDLHSSTAVLRPQMVLVDIDLPGAAASDFGSLAALGCQALAVGAGDDSRHRDVAASWGVALIDAAPAALAEQLRRPDHVSPHEPPRRRGRVIAVCGPAGAPGVSTVAANLAAELPGDPVLIDADPAAAAQAFIFGARAEPSGLLAALARSGAGVIDADSWRACLVEAPGGVRLATGTADAAALAGFADGLLAVTDASRDTAAATVLDCGSGELPGWGSKAVADADCVVVVAAPTALGIHRLTRWWSLHRPVLSGEVVLAWNRVGGSGTSALGADPVVRLREASALAGAGVGFAVLPEDDVAAAAMNRRPGPLAVVAADSALRAAVRDLAGRWSP